MDYINGLFELIGGILIFMDVYRLYKDKKIAGVYWPARCFYAGWGFWNLIYYPSLGHWWSTAGGALIVTANTIWCYLAIRYMRVAKLLKFEEDFYA